MASFSLLKLQCYVSLWGSGYTQGNCTTEGNTGGGGALNFFQVGVCGPDFRSVGLQTDICVWQGGLVSGKSNLGASELKYSKFWGLVSWVFPNLGACELKFGWKLRLLRLKFQNFLKRGSCELTFFAWNGTLTSGRRGVKRGSSGPHIPIPPF